MTRNGSGVPERGRNGAHRRSSQGPEAQGGLRYSKADGNGLLLDVTPAGVKSWVFRYRLNGKREKLVIGRYPDVTLKAARAERDKYAAQWSGKANPRSWKRSLRGQGLSANPTVREFGERYYTEQVVKNWKDPKHIRRYLDNEIFPPSATMQLKDVTALGRAKAGVPQA